MTNRSSIDATPDGPFVARQAVASASRTVPVQIGNVQIGNVQIGNNEEASENEQVRPAHASLDCRVSMAHSSPTLASRQDQLASLVDRIRARDAAAMQQLFEELGGVLYGVAFRLLRSKEDAEEVVCDAFTRAWHQSKNYDPSRGSVISWAIIMTRSIALDRLRSASHAHLAKWVDLNEALSAASVLDTDPAVAGQQGHRLQEALDSLPSEQKEVIVLAYFKGLSHSEIAQRLQQPLGTIKTRIRLALQRLRVSLEGLV